jgi:hypothetical protein
LRQLMAMPESFERDFTLQALFGSADAFRRSWSRYAMWADAKLVADAEATHRASSKR